ncbi:Bacterial conjugation TrbI-like protein [Rivularia sp. PCC 7116]|uniref:conjugal transfer protein TrbI n=1 Tax=Rivularia sp. PCC 7116 TaxID=373994 RepID=UPI00029ED18C|nr:conjugal transfer protein TrbI [Rivularia sp. PCC 7116]AFY53982.1 Bacterial conjugation TrbI-like protein [Rivularia sp. PCC 7116]
MTGFHRWKSGTAAFLALSITTAAAAPILISTPATAQAIFGQSRRVSIPEGVTLPVTFDKEKVVVTPDETSDLTLTVARNIIDSERNILIPRGSELVGRLEPATFNGEKGSQFVARELVFPDGNKQNIDATSAVVTNKETIKRGASTGRVLTDAAYGTAAATVISLITGNNKIETLEPLAGAAAGAIASILLNRKQVEVVVINPQNDLDVTLRSNLLLSRF